MMNEGGMKSGSAQLGQSTHPRAPEVGGLLGNQLALEAILFALLSELKRTVGEDKFNSSFEEVRSTAERALQTYKFEDALAEKVQSGSDQTLDAVLGPFQRAADK